jgi:hypothetical protein
MIIDEIKTHLDEMAAHAKTMQILIKALLEQKQETTQAIIDGPGFYRMRNGRDAVINKIDYPSKYPCTGWGVLENGNLMSMSWMNNGRHLCGAEHHADIIEKTGDL